MNVKRILVVDDDMHVREMLVQRLRSRGFEVEGSDSASGAMQKLDSTRYDLVVLDLILPKEGGKVVVEQVLAAHNGTQLIIMSGVARLWRKANPSVKVAGVLEKPFAFDDLLHFVNNS